MRRTRRRREESAVKPKEARRRKQKTRRTERSRGFNRFDLAFPYPPVEILDTSRYISLLNVFISPNVPQKMSSNLVGSLYNGTILKDPGTLHDLAGLTRILIERSTLNSNNEVMQRIRKQDVSITCTLGSQYNYYPLTQFEISAIFVRILKICPLIMRSTVRL